MSAPPPSLRHHTQAILALAWPVLVGQLAVLGFSTVDTLLLARHATADLAALSIGAAAYVTVFAGLMGVLLAVSPIVGQLRGAGHLAAAGEQARQAIWLALALGALGGLLLAFPGPLIALARPSAEGAEKITGYMRALALALPAILLFTVYRSFNVAISRPRTVMALQVGALLLKIPLTWLLIVGVPAWGLAPQGVLGCGIATAVVMNLQLLAAWVDLRRHPAYAPYRAPGRRRGLPAPSWPALAGLMRLGVPIGLSILIEATGFTAMAFLIARQHGDAVAGHQIAVNLVSLLYMVPLSLSNGTATLVAQRIGAGDMSAAHRIGWHGIGLGLVAAGLLGGLTYLLREPVLRLYAGDAAVVSLALPLLVGVWWFHVADSAQTLANFVLRSHRVTVLPMLVYAGCLWGIGLVGGWWVTHQSGLPPWLQGALGYWTMCAVGLTATSMLLMLLLWRVHRSERRACARDL